MTAWQQPSLRQYDTVHRNNSRSSCVIGLVSSSASSSGVRAPNFFRTFRVLSLLHASFTIARHNDVIVASCTVHAQVLRYRYSIDSSSFLSFFLVVLLLRTVIRFSVFAFVDSTRAPSPTELDWRSRGANDKSPQNNTLAF